MSLTVTLAGPVPTKNVCGLTAKTGAPFAIAIVV